MQNWSLMMRKIQVWLAGDSVCLCNLQWGIKRQTGEDRHALATAKPCWAQFFPLGILSKIRAPLWLLFHPSLCWLTQAIILTSGLHPNSLRHLVALILPPEASPPELCASAPCSYWALFGSLLLFPLFSSHASYIVFVQPVSMGNMVGPLIDERCCYEA